MKITITYKTGVTITENADYIEVTDAKLKYQLVMNPQPVIRPFIKIPLDNIAKFEITD